MMSMMSQIHSIHSTAAPKAYSTHSNVLFCASLQWPTAATMSSTQPKHWSDSDWNIMKIKTLVPTEIGIVIFYPRHRLYFFSFRVVHSSTHFVRGCRDSDGNNGYKHIDRKDPKFHLRKLLLELSSATELSKTMPLPNEKTRCAVWTLVCFLKLHEK